MTLYDISTNRCITKSIPEMRNKIICSSPYGWLVMKDVESNEYSLFHLESKINIKLPSISTSCRAAEYGVESNSIYFLEVGDRCVYRFNLEDETHEIISLPCPTEFYLRLDFGS
ncbi:hypothetical protein COLO4_22281 [Corchorus olitorius]|uniref:DUF295 domain-containing protein n=1 Tax=Corchorus olitorius TaxID=93759 RepID=A0A1R3IN14_9ROSI|nr:hypothetical protein COLO4_22281 [Corchorus olitorius]